MRKAMMAGQQVFGRVGRRLLVDAHHNRCAIGVRKSQFTRRAVKKRKQQADRHKENQRQPAEPTSDFLF
jgi:hypothetical protein